MKYASSHRVYCPDCEKTFEGHYCMDVGEERELRETPRGLAVVASCIEVGFPPEVCKK